MECLDETSSHVLHRIAASKFDTEGLAQKDWDYWYAQFNNSRNQLRGLALQPAASSTPEEIKAFVDSKRPKPFSAVASEVPPVPTPVPQKVEVKQTAE